MDSLILSKRVGGVEESPLPSIGNRYTLSYIVVLSQCWSVARCWRKRIFISRRFLGIARYGQSVELDKAVICLVLYVPRYGLPYRQRLALIWMYYASSVLSASGESVILGVITSCEQSRRKLLHFENLESRCGFSRGGFPLGLSGWLGWNVEREMKRWLGMV